MRARVARLYRGRRWLTKTEGVVNAGLRTKQVACTCTTGIVGASIVSTNFSELSLVLLDVLIEAVCLPTSELSFKSRLVDISCRQLKLRHLSLGSIDLSLIAANQFFLGALFLCLLGSRLKLLLAG